MVNDSKWYKSAYRRAVIDMHIPDWDEKFLAEFRADQYADALSRSKAQSIVAYAQSHVGLFNYPTQVGQQHRGLHGRNVMKEIIDACHIRQIAVVIYVSLIFDRWASDQHPEWRMTTHDGRFHGQGGRHGLLCPNSPYRQYVRHFVEEICTQFDFEGIRFDMTFWPALCYCRHCKERFAAEVGGDIPTTIDWTDERWVAFQRKREEWLIDFARIATESVRKLKPHATVEHQSSTFPLDWMFGVTAGLAEQTDFLQGDFYGDALQGSFVRKLLEDLTPNRPIGFETSATVELRDHTSLKSQELLEAKASSAIADHSAFVFIDAINPNGTVNVQPHDRMGRVFDSLMPYYQQLGGTRVRDIAIYYSPESKFGFTGSGRNVGNPDRSDLHTTSVVSVCKWLVGNHLPFGAVTKKAFTSLTDVKILILSNVNMMDDDECAAIREWVRNGGSIFASGGTSLVTKNGKLRKQFALSDVFGVAIEKADWQPREHYISPTEDGQKFLREYKADYPAFITGYTMDVDTDSTARVLATRTMPWPAPDATKFSSIHSNPPWESTGHPEVVLHPFGKGQAVYCSSLLEIVPGLSASFIRLLRALHNDYRFEAEAPASVEVTLFHQPDRHRYILSMVNFQKDLPNIPVDDIRIQLRLPQHVAHITQIPEGRRIRHTSDGGVVGFTSPRFQTLAMFAIETR